MEVVSTHYIRLHQEPVPQMRQETKTNQRQDSIQAKENAMINIRGVRCKVDDHMVLECELLSTGDVQLSIMDRSEFQTKETSVVVGLEDFTFLVSLMQLQKNEIRDKQESKKGCNCE